MPTIVRLSNAKIQMFADDHMPPHFHLYGPRSNALIAIGTLTVLRGRVDPAIWPRRRPGRGRTATP